MRSGSPGAVSRQSEEKRHVENQAGDAYTRSEWLYLPAAGRHRGKREWNQELGSESSDWGELDRAALVHLLHPFAEPKTIKITNKLYVSITFLNLFIHFI